MPTPWNKGKKLGEEYKKKVSSGTKLAMSRPEVKIKISKTQFHKGINPWNKGKTNVYSKTTIRNIKKARLKQIFPKKYTKIEIILFKILEDLGVKFKRHKAIKNICQADVFIPPNIVIFADGDYWHCNPSFYPNPKTPSQIKNIKRDKKANKKLIKEGYIILRLWEIDLMNHKEKSKNILMNLIGGDKNAI